MWLSNKKRKDISANHMQDQAAQCIADMIIRKQYQFSCFLSQIIGSLPVGQLKLLIVVFCLVGSGLSFYLFTGAVFSSGKVNDALAIDQVQRPGYFGRTLDVLVQQAATRWKEYYHLQQFKSYLDSLQGDVQGKKLYDSILLTRPSLLDSIKLIENILLQQHKK